MVWLRGGAGSPPDAQKVRIRISGSKGKGGEFKQRRQQIGERRI